MDSIHTKNSLPHAKFLQENASVKLELCVEKSETLSNRLKDLKTLTFEVCENIE